jgi:hypothetical protein
MGRSSVVTKFEVTVYDQFWDRESGSKTDAGEALDVYGDARKNRSVKRGRR